MILRTVLGNEVEARIALPGEDISVRVLSVGDRELLFQAVEVLDSADVPCCSRYVADDLRRQSQVTG